MTNTIKLVLDGRSGRTWAVRLVQRGDSHGQHDELTHDDDEPLVEFFDTRVALTPLGRHVATFGLDSLLDRRDDALVLDGGVLGATAMADVTQWLRQASRRPPTPTVHALRGAMQRKVVDLAREGGSLNIRTSYADNYWVVTVHADGSTEYAGYAQEARGPRGSIADLRMWELSGFLDRAAA